MKNIQNFNEHQSKKAAMNMIKGSPMTVAELRKLKTGDHIHLEYYNDEGERVCNRFVKLFISDGFIDAEGYPIPVEKLPDTTIISGLDNSGYTFTVCSALPSYQENLNIIMSRKCKKSLYKSTYKGNAFTKDKTYNIVDEDDDFFYIIDNEGRKFSMHKTPSNTYYYIDDYFYSL